jgi:hypothetical protein
MRSGGEVGDLGLSDRDGPGEHRDHADEGLEQRRLARPVGTDDGDDLAGRRLDVDLVDDGATVVAGGDRRWP